MFFRVENLGPLREAEVDLSKDLILLTGPNNTGKTYLAWSVYGLLRSRGQTKVFQEIADELLNQRKVARVLAKAVNRGLKLMMSTHSDYVLRELNNLILLSRDAAPIQEVRKKHGYTEAELLSPDKVGVYLFRDGTAESVPVTPDGFEVKTIEEEINRLNAISQEIYAALYA
jgi:hypothetical protein